MNGQFVEFRGIAFDTLRIAIDEEVDPVFGLDDRLIDDQLFAVVPLKLGLETQDTQLGARPASFLALAIARLTS